MCSENIPVSSNIEENNNIIDDKTDKAFDDLDYNLKEHTSYGDLDEFDKELYRLYPDKVKEIID